MNESDSKRQGASLSHLDERGAARMVDVSGKEMTVREAVATAVVTAPAPVLDAVEGQRLDKGDALAVARIAGIQAAKQTAWLIPLCHPLAVDFVGIEFARRSDCELLIRCTARTAARTGVEMEAMTGASVAALAIYDMAKSADKGVVIGPVRLESKSGGKRGPYRRD
jgi:cyclic pyranopterin phosphate synthase